jgi:hypothetical protein
MANKITAKLNFYIEFYLLIAVCVIVPVFLLFVMPNMIQQSYTSVSANGDVENKRFSNVPLTTDEVVNTFVKNAVLYSLSFTADNLENSREKARPYYSDSAFSTDFQTIENERINLINNSDVLIARVTIPDELVLLGTRN